MLTNRYVASALFGLLADMSGSRMRSPPPHTHHSRVGIEQVSFVREDGHWIRVVQPQRIRVTSRLPMWAGNSGHPKEDNNRDRTEKHDHFLDRGGWHRIPPSLSCSSHRAGLLWRCCSCHLIAATEDATLVIVVMQLGANHRMRPLLPLVYLRGREHPQRRRHEIDP